jgi:hypothetical protein
MAASSPSLLLRANLLIFDAIWTRQSWVAQPHAAQGKERNETTKRPRERAARQRRRADQRSGRSTKMGSDVFMAASTMAT